MPTNVEEYFTNQEGNKDVLVAKEIFRAEPENVDIKTDLSHEEIQKITTLMYNNDLLKSKQLKPVYKNFLKNYMRLKISLERKSRTEFVDINKSNDMKQGLQDLSNFKNIEDSKK